MECGVINVVGGAIYSVWSNLRREEQSKSPGTTTSVILNKVKDLIQREILPPFGHQDDSLPGHQDDSLPGHQDDSLPGHQDDSLPGHQEPKSQVIPA
jgi:hypothetical protein